MSTCKLLLGVFLTVILISADCIHAYALRGLTFIPQKVVGQKVWDFDLPTIKDQKFKLHETIAGKRAIIFFWATWCPYCRKQMTIINNLYKEIIKNEIIVVFVNVGEPKAVVKKYLDRNKYNFDVVMDYKESLGELYPMEGLPAFFFVDEKSLIQSRQSIMPKDYLKYFGENDRKNPV